MLGNSLMIWTLHLLYGDPPAILVHMKGQGKTAFKILFPVPHMTSDLVLLAAENCLLSRRSCWSWCYPGFLKCTTRRSGQICVLGAFLVEPGFAVTDGFRLSGNQTLLGKRYWKKLGIQLPKYIVPELPLGFGYELDQNSMILLLFFTSGTTIYFWSSQTGHSLLLWSQILLQTILASSS